MDDDDEGGFIRGIFNYCDRWCERCALTGRCRVFAAEHSGPPLRNMSDEEFWQHLNGIFAQTLEMVRQSAEEMGLDLGGLEREDDAPHPWNELEHDDLLQSARAYAMDVQSWLDSAARLDLDDVPNDDESARITVGDALEIIGWYQFQIVVKLTRAMSGLVEAAEGDCYAQSDCDGSAKVALIGIDRSLMAWHFLAQRSGDSFARQQIIALIADLGGLRRATERRFPAARSFVRPGFDSPLPEQMN